MILPTAGWRRRWSSLLAAARLGRTHRAACQGAIPFVWLFSESTGRVLVSVKRGTERDLASLCRTNGVKLTRLGEVTDSEEATLEVVGQFTLPLARILRAWQSTPTGR